ncbi:MAG: right-handed parallel beta-helix repeat-containing protein [Planctomycetota bacterium]
MMVKVNLDIFLATCAFFAALAAPAGAITHHVAPGESIQAAIDDANDGDAIEVAPDTYYEQINFLGKAVRVYSMYGPDITIIDANGAYHAVQCVSGEDANTVLEGFTITGGDADNPVSPDQRGGGMYNDQSSPTVINCIFRGNSAQFGGGMYNYQSSPTVTDCEFIDNLARNYGGGMYNRKATAVALTNCSFSGNSAEEGAGMYSYHGSPTLTDCTFSDNEADGRGGGMYSDNAELTLDDCTFSQNRSGDSGGGVYAWKSILRTTDCTFSDNEAAKSGGGMRNSACQSGSVTNCTFSLNSAGTDGGGMFNLESSLDLTDCAFSDNQAAGDGGGMYNEAMTYLGLDSCTFSRNSANVGGGMQNENNSSPTMTDCIFSYNEGTLRGGGMHNEGNSCPILIRCVFGGNTTPYYGAAVDNFSNSDPDFINCLFVRNDAGVHGGAMCNDMSSPTLLHCTLSENSAGSGAGAAMFNYQNSRPELTNCIVWANTPDQISNWDYPGSDTTVTYSDVQGGYGGAGNINLDPLFAPGGWRPSSSASPCVDTGINPGRDWPLTDLLGNPRRVDGDLDGTATVDMGAYEFQIGAIHNITQDHWYDSIQLAIDGANDLDEIEVGAGIYYEAINFAGKAVRLYSTSGPGVTTIDGTGSFHVVQCVSGEEADTILEGFTITGGDANGPGGDDQRGGGMYIYLSAPTVMNCNFTANTANFAGGLFSLSADSLSLTNCTFYLNSAAIETGGLHIHSCADAVVTNCGFISNTAPRGGGIQNAYSNTRVINCTFVGNSTDADGAGIHNRSDSVMKVTNCILWDNEPNQLYGDESSPTIVNYSNIQGGWGDPGDANNTNIDADPRFVDADNPDPNLWNLSLMPDSPCIDAADSTPLIAEKVLMDLGGNLRYEDVDTVTNTGSGPWDYVDMGAYEFRCSGIPGDLNCDGAVK